MRNTFFIIIVQTRYSEKMHIHRSNNFIFFISDQRLQCLDLDFSKHGINYVPILFVVYFLSKNYKLKKKQIR